MFAKLKSWWARYWADVMTPYSDSDYWDHIW